MCWTDPTFEDPGSMDMSEYPEIALEPKVHCPVRHRKVHCPVPHRKVRCPVPHRKVHCPVPHRKVLQPEASRGTLPQKIYSIVVVKAVVAR